MVAAMKRSTCPLCEFITLFRPDAERFLGCEFVSNDERLDCYTELITQLNSLVLDPCGDVRLLFSKSDFVSYSKFVNLLMLAFPRVPYSLITSDDSNYIVVMRKDVLLKYLIYSDFSCI